MHHSLLICPLQVKMLLRYHLMANIVLIYLILNGVKLSFRLFYYWVGMKRKYPTSGLLKCI